MADLHEDDVIRILLEQHDQVRAGFEQVRTSTGEARSRAFDDLRAFLAVHETAEEEVLRPVTKELGEHDVAAARNSEESRANAVLAQLEDLDVDSAEFETSLAQLQAAVTDHAAMEEAEEFPAILAAVDEGRRHRMGGRLRAAERLAPTHPHPGTAGSGSLTHLAVGPFVAIADRVRDALSRDD
jgi:hypothetical protein